MSGRVTEPYRVAGPRQMVGKLMCGKWLVFPHEWLGDDCDLDTWKLNLLTVAEEMNVPVLLFDVPRKDMTVAVREGCLPTMEQVKLSVAAMEHHRWTGRPVATELQVRTERLLLPGRGG